MKKYVMSETSKAVSDIVSLSDELENKYRRSLSDPDILHDCRKILQAIVELEDIVPFELNELPKMMMAFIDSVIDLSFDGKTSKEAINVKASELIPVVEGFSGICQRGYLDHFTDIPGGGLSDVRVEDLKDRDFKRHALLVYRVSPFMDNIGIKGHTTAQDARSISEVLDELGYSVDVINPWYEGELDHGKYDLVIGFRKAFEDMLPLLREDCVKIYYLTTMNSYIANMAEMKRIEEFYKRNKMRPAYRRLEYSCMDLERIYMCDGAICLGNGYTVSTYEGMFKKLLAQNVSGFKVNVDRTNAPEKKGFLWYGGAGSLHKGLDLCIEAFRDIQDLNLHIVGKIDDDIYEFYRDEIEGSSNVFYHGYLYHDDKEFIDVCADCSFSLGVSCSESQSTAMITAIFAGLVPVCCDETGIDTEEYGGIRIGSSNIKELKETVIAVSKMTDEEIRKRRLKGAERVRHFHTTEAYKDLLRLNIMTIISGEAK